MLRYNKTGFNKGHHHFHWLKLKDVLMVLRSRIMNK